MVATSRTGTARYKRVRREALAQAQDRGITHCLCTLACKHHRGRPCGVLLNFEVGRLPNSAEPDHIRPHANGGRDTVENMGRIVCRRCNQARGNKPLEVEPSRVVPATTSTLVAW